MTKEWYSEHHESEDISYRFFCQGEYPVAMYMKFSEKESLHYREGSDLRRVKKALKEEFSTFYLEKVDNLSLPFQPYPGRLMDTTLCCYRDEKRENY